MEVRLDSVPDQAPPQETFVSLRIGDVQKQSRFNSSRTYRFPEPPEGKSGIGRIEVFKRLGFVNVTLDPIDGEFQDVEVPCEFPGMEKLKMKLAVFGARKTAPAVDKKGRAKERVDAAQKYLQDHRIEEILADVMREVIQAKPENPHSFISGRIPAIAAEKGFEEKPGQGEATKLPKQAATQQPCSDELKATVAGKLELAVQSGDLQNLLMTMKKEQQVSPKTDELRAVAAGKLEQAYQSGDLRDILQTMKNERQATLMPADGSEPFAAATQPLPAAPLQATLAPTAATMPAPVIETPAASEDPAQELRRRARDCLVGAGDETLKSAIVASLARSTLCNAGEESLVAAKLTTEARSALLGADEESLVAAKARSTLCNAGEESLGAAKLTTEARSALLGADEESLVAAKAKSSLLAADEETLKAAKARSRGPSPERTKKPTEEEAAPALPEMPAKKAAPAMPEPAAKQAPPTAAKEAPPAKAQPMTQAKPCLFDTQPFHLLPSSGTWYCRLASAKAPVAPAPAPSAEEKGIELLRGRAFETLAKASHDGSLAAVLSKRSPSAEEKDMEVLRARAQETLLQASQDGSLAAALSQKSAEDKGIDALRARAQETLLQASQDGSLAAELSKQSAQEKDMEALRMRAQDTLLKASQNGSLSAALSKPTAPAQENDMEVLRMRAQETLLQASQDGSLAAALHKPSAPAQEKSIEALRVTAAETLIQASKDGTLSAAMIKPAAPAEVTPFSFKASVGTWLVKRPMVAQIWTLPEEPAPEEPAQPLSKEPEPAAAPPAPSAAPTEVPAPSPALGRRFAMRPSVGAWLAGRLQAPSPAPAPAAAAAPAAPAPAAPAPAPAPAAAPAPAPAPLAAGRRFAMRPSVGAWLAARLQAPPAPAEALETPTKAGFPLTEVQKQVRNALTEAEKTGLLGVTIKEFGGTFAAPAASVPTWEHLPSVGSWVQKPGPRRRRLGATPRSTPAAEAAPALPAQPAEKAAPEPPELPAKQAPPMEAKEAPAEKAAPELPELPAKQAPPMEAEEASAAKAGPPEEAQPDITSRTYSDMVKMDREELIDSFTLELKRKEEEIAELRRMLAERKL